MSTIETAHGACNAFATGEVDDHVNGRGTKKIITVAMAAFGLAAGLTAFAGGTAPVANACSNVINNAGMGLGNGGGVRESCLPNGDKYHCESVYVMGFGGENCFTIPKGDARNP